MRFPLASFWKAVTLRAEITFLSVHSAIIAHIQPILPYFIFIYEKNMPPSIPKDEVEIKLILKTQGFIDKCGWYGVSMVSPPQWKGV